MAEQAFGDQLQHQNMDLITIDETTFIDPNALRNSILGKRITMYQLFSVEGIQINTETSIFIDRMTNRLQFQIRPVLENVALDHEIDNYRMNIFELNEDQFFDYLVNIDPNMLNLFPFDILCYNHVEYLMKILLGKLINLVIDTENKMILPHVLKSPKLLLEPFTQKILDTEFVLHFYHNEETDFTLAFHSIETGE